MADSLTHAQQKRILFFSVGAFFLYGGWAVFANSQHGLRRGLLSGFAQGLMSLLSTALLTTGIERLFLWLEPGRGRFWMAGLGPCWAVCSLMSLVHWLLGTPEVLKTIMPSVVVGTLFAISYTLGLTRLERQADVPRSAGY